MEDSERKKAVELLKEMRNENKAVGDQSGNQETHLNWMYKGPSDLIDREEYLLGKAIDKNFEVLNSGGSPDIGRTGEQSNVPKRLLGRATDSLEQVDVAKKILEDPLYAIKQKEMEARKKLLNNPVKLKQIKQMLLERSKQSSSHKIKKKRLKQKSEEDLNFLILKKLEKLTDKEKRKAFNKILKSGFDSNSVESSSSNNKKYKKHKLKRKRSYSSSDEYDSSSESSSSSERPSKRKKKKSRLNKKKQKRRNEESSFSSSSSDYEKNRKSKNKINIKQFKKTFDLKSEGSTIHKKIRKSQERSLRNFKNSIVKNKRVNLREENTGKGKNTKYKGERKGNKEPRNSFSDEEIRFKKNYGLTIPDGSDPEKRKREFHVQKEQKSVEEKKKYILPAKVKPLSDKEKEEKLKEMMENAKLRKEDREKNLANHRKKQALEEESKIYDDDFMRRQMSHLTSRGTMADRIKSNINNIQRSKSSMDVSFMRK